METGRQILPSSKTGRNRDSCHLQEAAYTTLAAYRADQSPSRSREQSGGLSWEVSKRHSDTPGVLTLEELLGNWYLTRDGCEVARGCPIYSSAEVSTVDALVALLEAGADSNPSLRAHVSYREHGVSMLGMGVAGAIPFRRAAFAHDLERSRRLVACGPGPNLATGWPEAGIRARRRRDGCQQERVSDIRSTCQGSR